MANILVVDDQLGIRDLLFEILNDEGHTVDLAENAAQAKAARLSGRPDLVLLDIWMPDTDGVTLLKEWALGGLLTMPVVMMSGHGTIEAAVEAIKIGAFAFLEKPISLQKLLKTVSQTLTAGALRATSDTLKLEEQQKLEDLSLTKDNSFQKSTQVVLMSTQNFLLDKPLREARDEFEKCYFEFHLTKQNGSMTRVADTTGLERTHLYRKLKQLGVDLTKGKRHLI